MDTSCQFGVSCFSGLLALFTSSLPETEKPQLSDLFLKMFILKPKFINRAINAARLLSPSSIRVLIFPECFSA